MTSPNRMKQAFSIVMDIKINDQLNELISMIISSAVESCWQRCQLSHNPILAFGVHPICPWWWEVLPEASRLLFIPQCSWGFVRLCFFLPSPPLCLIFSSLKGLEYHIHTHFPYFNRTCVVRGAGLCQHSLLTKLTTYLQLCIISLDYCCFWHTPVTRA